MSIEKPKQYFDILQIFRGIAALMIIIHHANGSFNYYHHVNDYLLSFLAAVGKYGVDFFFVLSGFIISYTAFNKQGNPTYIRTYLVKRILRIYVAYLPITVVMLFLYYLLPAFSSANRNISILTSLTLIPNGSPALSVAWTLIHEMLFYLLFVLFFFSRKQWDIFALIWVFLIVLYNYCLKALLPDLGSFITVFLSPYNIEFVLGYCLVVLIKKESSFKVYVSGLISIILFFSFLLFKNLGITLFDFYLNFLFSFACCFLIYWAVKGKNIRLSKGNVFMIIGNATYSIYLLHNPIQAILIRYLPKVDNRPLVLGVELLFTVCICCIIGYLYYLIFEKKVLNKLNFLLLSNG